MSFQTTFQRYELKYLLNKEEQSKILKAMVPFMRPDAYGRTTIRNLYFDTENYRLIRNSIEKPVYKEKLRIRSYSQASADSTVFVELKKKYDAVVYKRRIALQESEAMAWTGYKSPCPARTQISAEIDYFLDYYRSLRPAVFLSYAREAYYTIEKSDFRVTFDDSILCRQDALSLRTPVSGTALIPEDTVLMEIKCSGAIPLWMTAALSENNIRKTSFSKYGTAYRSLIFPAMYFKNQII